MYMHAQKALQNGCEVIGALDDEEHFQRSLEKEPFPRHVRLIGVVTPPGNERFQEPPKPKTTLNPLPQSSHASAMLLLMSIACPAIWAEKYTRPEAQQLAAMWELSLVNISC